MTLYGWDTSHYDGALTRAILTRAKAEGITFWTHKIGEGLDNTDPQAAAAFTAAKGVFPVMGGYYFLHAGQDMTAQAHRCVVVADQVAPYWRTFDGWFWQTDAETESPYGLPSAPEVKTFSDTLADLTDKTVIVYASAGQYGNRLAGLEHPLWNAHYGTNPVGAFKDVYPGDHSAGWNPYSGQTPALLQYGSNTTIAGLTTCDANAFPGTLDDLLALINPGGAMSTLDAADLAAIQKIVQTEVAKTAAQVWGFDPNDTTGVANPWFRTDAPAHVPPGTNVTVAPSWFIRYALLSLYNIGQALGIDLAAVGDRPYTAAEAAALKAAHDALVAQGGAMPPTSAEFSGTLHFGAPAPTT